MKPTEWKVIPGWGDYEVSNKGQVRRGGEELRQFSSPKGYPITQLSCKPCRCTLFVHRLVAKTFNIVGEDQEVDHINMDKWDNRIDNLRPATRTQNVVHVGKRADNTSGYKGVHFDRGRGKWIAQTNINGKRKCLGAFETAELASEFYNLVVETIHGKSWITH